jgi:diguanylate cyclase (GGDEF)-like protein
VAALQTVRGRAIQISVSLGVARLRDEDNPQALFKRADQAMYKAKKNGRNRSELG